ncbi:MAG: hypothetical protein AB1700_20140 [Bacillota bacterium]
MIRDEDAKVLDRLLERLEKGFRIVLFVLLTLVVLGQAVLLTEEGRSRFSRVDRLEGVKLRMVQVRASRSVNQHR